MPVSHIGLTVSHLPTSCSFFLSALQPLGYQFIGQQGNQIGLGIDDADFFLCQETPGLKAGAAHIAFTALDRTAVRNFYTAALNAGGRPHGSPAIRDQDTGYFNAAILDFDGNSIEVVFRDEPDTCDDGTVIEHSRVLTWQKSVHESVRDDISVASASTARTSKKSLVPAAPSVAPSVRALSVVSKAPTPARSFSAPVTVPTTHSSTISDGAAKKIIGTLLGAAAGAAVAYAMVKSEEGSAKAEAEFNAAQAARSQPAQQVPAPQPRLSIQEPQSIYEAPPRTIHRNISDTDSYYSTPHHALRAIEAPPPARSYHTPTYASVPPTQVPDRQSIQYIQGASPANHHYTYSMARSVSSPTTVQQARSKAPSTLISSFVPSVAPSTPPADRRSSTGSTHSKAKSHVSRHSKADSKAPSLVGSILGRNLIEPLISEQTWERDSVGTSTDNENTSHISRRSRNKHLDIDSCDTDTVAPSDSISNAGSSSRRSHHSKHSSSKSHHSHSHSHRSEVSTRSKHSSSSKHSRKSRSGREEPEIEIVRPSTISEPSDASTVRPSKSKRKDSGFGGVNEGGWGTVASLPVRGITESMIEEGDRPKGKGRKRSVVSYAMGQ